MALSVLDLNRLDEALRLAEGAIGLSDPNPRVGCIIGRADGSVLGQGHTQAAGQGHAEVQALSDARARGLPVAGATAWVTLEPCSHHGRTPPCADALVAAGVSRVVVGGLDPFPDVNGKGVERLRSAGIVVELAPDEFQTRARELNIGFLHRVLHGRPWVRLKVATSLDGRTALPNGTSKWITGPAARADAQYWRRRAGAVLTGIGTILADDPLLNVRAPNTARQPIRIVLDSLGQLPPEARVFDSEGEVWVYSATALPSSFGGHSHRSLRWRHSDGSSNEESLPKIIEELGMESINELHVEAGSKLTGAFLKAGLVNEIVLYMAPTLLGAGRPLANIEIPESLPSRYQYTITNQCLIGRDLRLTLRPGQAPLPPLQE